MWHIVYADNSRTNDGKAYVVTDGKTRIPVDAKSEGIAMVQRRNGWKVDGKESTLGQQIRDSEKD